jgi:hypothetical protein
VVSIGIADLGFEKIEDEEKITVIPAEFMVVTGLFLLSLGKRGVQESQDIDLDLVPSIGRNIFYVKGSRLLSCASLLRFFSSRSPF